MRGAPQVGFSATIRKIKARTSLLTRFRPPTWLILETHVQYKRNPARCQFTTVLGVTKTRDCLHPDQHILNATQNSLCRAVNRRRGRCACRASNCRRRARFSRTRSTRQLKELTNQPRRCRSDTIMARILAEKTESSFAPSHSFRRCTTFWRGTRSRVRSSRGSTEYLTASFINRSCISLSFCGFLAARSFARLKSVRTSYNSHTSSSSALRGLNSQAARCTVPASQPSW